MTILSCLLRWLLPPLVFFAACMTLFFYFYWHAGMLDVSALLALIATIVCGITLIGCVFFVVNSISKPIQKLKDTALDIAAGDYRSTIVNRNAPQEIMDLADALHTMSECVQENIHRTQVESARKVRMQGEYECALLLQKNMLDKVIESFSNDHLRLRWVAHVTANPPHGLLLNTTQEQNGNCTIHLYEASESGYQGMYNLLYDRESCSQQLKLIFLQKNHLLEYTAQEMPAPIIWSTQHEKLLEATPSMKLHQGDLVFLYNNGFTECFDTPQRIQQWFHKVLRHFAVEGMDLFETMINCEVNFLTKKHHIDHDINILCIQIL